MLLKQRPIVHFDTPQYEAPTLTHSHRMDLYQIIGWFPPTRDGTIKAFAYDHRAFQRVGQSVDDSLEFVGYSIDLRVVRKIRYHPLIVNFVYLFKARQPLEQPYWVHMGLFDESLDIAHLYLKHVPTHGLIAPQEWPVDQVIQEHHVRLIPDSLPRKKFRVRVTITTEAELDWNNLDSYKWFDPRILRKQEKRD